ncbi:PDZ domain-containing protein [Sphingobium sufflavum]|uniref:type II secretion system protein N n=1 Tax=Sphingobium sufflavum TaxID=1129547 RepID=UPI001F4079DB|nr:type II secretion system protein N [Sphingobium sufflavum]MCE7797507.1 PDZ domain-containing protein [Sphingobium sufflavum]
MMGSKALMLDRIGNFRSRLPRYPVAAMLAKGAEAALLLMLVVQVARLVWAVVTPLGMVGEWQAKRPAILPAAARIALFQAFDPFTRGQAADLSATQVTGLALQLFGTRINEGSGQASAIIATPDGVQSSFAVGDQILPGVTLKTVSYDHVVIDRGGAAETLFLDQSAGGAPTGTEGGAPVEGGQAPAAADGGGGPAPAGPAALTAAMVQRDIGFMPRSEGGRVSGIILSSKGAGFQAAGFQSGDIITQVNGRPVTSMGDLAGIQAQLRPGARLSLMIERGAATVPVSVTLSGGQ